jgi:hypothetical protein
LFAPGLPQQFAFTPLTEQPLGSEWQVSPAGQLSQQMPFESTSWQWQTSPSGTHVPDVQADPLGFEQVPSFRVASKIWHVTSPSPGSTHIVAGAPPQQSEFCEHRSPWMRQPPAGWQMVESLVPYFPQYVLQHLLTVVELVAVHPVQVTPSTRQVPPGMA